MTGPDDLPPVRPGDVIVHLGTPHLIDRIDHQADGTPVARAADGWGITLSDDGRHRVPQPHERNCHLPAGAVS